MTDNASARRRALKVLAGVPAGAALAGCSSVLPFMREPPRLFLLTPKTTFSEDLPTVNWQMVLEPPVAAAGLDTTRIALMRSPTELEYYARVSWTDKATDMIQTLMIESFEGSNRIVSVGRESVLLRSDFVLSLELREFQVEYFRDGTPQARVRINAKLVRMPQRTIVGSHGVEYIQQAEEDSIEPVIAAFDYALGKVLKGIVEWTLRTGNRVYA